jgi:hypothetical protein
MLSTLQVVLLTAVGLWAAGVTALELITPHDARPAAMIGMPRFEGPELVLPEDYRRWTFVSASVGLSYDDRDHHSEPGLFHNIYVQPWALDAYLATGAFPERTAFAMELYTPAAKTSPLRHGFFQQDRVAVEMSVKDSSLFEDRWACFDFGSSGRTARAQPSGGCFACHATHAATDSVFTQFYPTLRERPE